MASAHAESPALISSSRPFAARGPNRGPGPTRSEFQSVPSPIGTLSTLLTYWNPWAKVLSLPGQSFGTGLRPQVRKSAAAVPCPNIPPVSMMNCSWALDFEFSLGHRCSPRRYSDFGGVTCGAGNGGMAGGDGGDVGASGRGAIRRAPLWADTSGYGLGVGCIAISWAFTALFSDMWSRSMTMPRRIASSTASSPAVVRPVALRSPAGGMAVATAAASGCQPIDVASASILVHSADLTVTRQLMSSSVIVGSAVGGTDSVPGNCPVRAQVLSMKWRSYRAIPPKALSLRWTTLTCTTPRS